MKKTVLILFFSYSCVLSAAEHSSKGKDEAPEFWLTLPSIEDNGQKITHKVNLDENDPIAQEPLIDLVKENARLGIPFLLALYTCKDSATKSLEHKCGEANALTKWFFGAQGEWDKIVKTDPATRKEVLGTINYFSIDSDKVDITLPSDLNARYMGTETDFLAIERSNEITKKTSSGLNLLSGFLESLNESKEERDDALNNKAVLYKGLANHFNNAGDSDESMRWLQKAKEEDLNQKSDLSHADLEFLGDINVKKGNVDVAIEYYHDAIEKGSAPSILKVIKVYQKEKLFDKAIEMTKDAIDKKGVAYAKLLLVELYAQVGRIPEARQVLNGIANPYFRKMTYEKCIKPHLKASEPFSKKRKISLDVDEESPFNESSCKKRKLD